MPNTLAQLEAFVSSAHYDAATAAVIAARIPELPRLKGEQISPGVTRIHGNLCNVHGRYGPCDKALSGKKKPGKGRKPAKPKVDRAAQHAQNRSATLTAQGYSPADQAALGALRDGTQPASVSPALLDKGLIEQAQDGSYRMTASGRALLGAADQGDAGRARDTASGAADRLAARRTRQAEQAQRRQDSAGKRAAAQLTRRQRADAAAKKRAAKKPSGGGGSKKPAAEKPRKVAAPRRQLRRSGGSAPSVGGVAGAAANKKPPKPALPAKAPAKQVAPALVATAQSLSDGKELTDADTQALIRNGLARLVKGELVLTAAGQRVTQKEHTIARWNGRAWVKDGVVVAEPDQSRFAGHTMEDWDDTKPDSFYKAAPSFRVFKDASGRHRWVAQSSTAYQDRDQEIVSTKALADDCAFADEHQSYGPLRWWHTPGLDLGDCDFNAMHGRILIESGTFRSPAIAQKVAAAAAGLEISLGFLHLPTEPDASGVFHHIRRFERSLVPRGKASNRFTAFSVKESTMFDPTKVAALKVLGFSDQDIAGLQSTAEATEKAATDQGVAFKAVEPVAEHPDVVINGVTYKAALAPSPLDPANPPAVDETVVEEDAIEDMPDEVDDAGGLTLSPEDITAIGSAVAEQIGPAIAQVMGALDLEKKVAGHVQGMLAPFQAQKDASDAEKAEQIATLQVSIKSLQDNLNELLGLQPAVTPRATATPTTALNPFNPADNALLAAVKEQVPLDQQGYVNGFEDLTKNLFGR